MKSIIIALSLSAAVHLGFTQPLVSPLPASASPMVYICQSRSAYAYHNMRRGLKNCRHSVEKVSLAEAERLGKRPCGYCY
ncbi:MAG: hypothetical protein IPL33_15940 [Sphingobacteriales bacterium]|nr:hypothetical protein [Sphingobacteriales bacterium]